MLHVYRHSKFLDFKKNGHFKKNEATRTLGKATRTLGKATRTLGKATRTGLVDNV